MLLLMPLTEAIVVGRGTPADECVLGLSALTAEALLWISARRLARSSAFEGVGAGGGG